jgi:hypothetical protein
MIEKTKKRKKRNPEGCAALKKKADNIFSVYIRLRDNGQCISCGYSDDVKKMQAGHYISRACLLLRYNEVNVNCQCPRCNLFLSGNIISYRENLIARYGEEIVLDLEARRHETCKMRVEDYRAIIDRYSEKVKRMR